MTPLRTAAFLKRLQTELPVWARRGWVAAEHQQSILDHVAQQARESPRYLVLVLSTMGALLFGAGVITFFAANWGLIPKAVKLTMLFGALGACYGAAAVCFTRQLEALGHGLLLLGVILFGANIFLIAQIYHIDAHYPNGVLIWSLGALVTAGLARSPLALVAAIALAMLWSGMEMFAFDRAPHGWFFIPWLAALGLIYRHGWVPALRVACAALLGWCLLLVFTRHFMGRFWIGGEPTAGVVSVHKTGLTPPAEHVILRGEVVESGTRSWDPESNKPVAGEYVRVRYGIESYFVPEGEGRMIERPAPEEKISIRVAIDARGRAAIQALLVNGQQRYVEKLF